MVINLNCYLLFSHYQHDPSFSIYPLIAFPCDVTDDCLAVLHLLNAVGSIKKNNIHLPQYLIYPSLTYLLFLYFFTKADNFTSALGMCHMQTWCSRESAFSCKAASVKYTALMVVKSHIEGHCKEKVAV